MSRKNSLELHDTAIYIYFGYHSRFLLLSMFHYIFNQLSFLAKKKGRGYNSDIALDDITFRSGLCSSLSTTQSKGNMTAFPF